MNNILLIISIIGIFSLIILIKKFLGKEGLIGWIGIASILANILVIKNVTILGMKATLGNVLFASNFLATDILTECYEYSEAKKGVLFGIFSVIMFLIITQVSLLYHPNSLDFTQSSFATLFSITPRITLASVSLFALSNIIDVKLYEYLRKKYNNKKMWLRNNICTIICNGLENFAFVILSFAGIYKFSDILIIAGSTTVIEIIVAICDTPFLYLAKSMNKKETLH